MKKKIRAFNLFAQMINGNFLLCVTCSQNSLIQGRNHTRKQKFEARARVSENFPTKSKIVKFSFVNRIVEFKTKEFMANVWMVMWQKWLAHSRVYLK